ncbi:uncharacterized protein LOC114361598 [Ostrinia furnacalis]|uniref:uncharacterized protein LOC114361598 n=1 Tax=Ostrinia furnacalis TaxID=93504 RepID=UPI00103FA793|nr:uncharacterized protein LOC114361598 [Ostrinia furnacalis]XP_028172495.1 uncharacterized protein LOC114361598 [Ostrinia furnacalis]XP_028172496.1 uncharacterized protein LOC114361598 [Ostrinia furnacalis]
MSYTWTELDKTFFKLVAARPALFKKCSIRHSIVRESWTEVSEEMCKLGHDISPKGCNDKFVKVRKSFKKTYNDRKLNPFIRSKYLDGTLKFLEDEIEKEKRKKKSGGFHIPPVLASKSATGKGWDSDTTDEESDTNYEETTSNVSRDEKQSLIKRKINVDEASNSEEPKIKAACYKSNASIIKLSSTLTFAKDDDEKTKPDIKDFAVVQELPSTTSEISSQSELKDISITGSHSTDMSMEICKTLPENDDPSAKVEKIKKEVSSILDVNSEEDDIKLFFSEICDYVLNCYTHDEEIDIRWKVFSVLSEAEKEDSTISD